MITTTRTRGVAPTTAAQVTEVADAVDLDYVNAVGRRLRIEQSTRLAVGQAGLTF